MTFGLSLWKALQRKLQGGAFIFEGGAGRKIPKDSKVINLTNPKEILEKIRNLKRSELNTNSSTIRTKLYDMIYVPEKIKASEFWDKFED